MKKRLYPKANEPPTAMVNSEGKLLTSEYKITKEAAIHYKKVFSHREMKNGLEHIKREREQLCEARLKQASSKKITRMVS